MKLNALYNQAVEREQYDITYEKISIRSIQPWCIPIYPSHKIFRTIYSMFTRRETYHDLGFYYAAAHIKKNAPRWIKALETQCR